MSYSGLGQVHLVRRVRPKNVAAKTTKGWPRLKTSQRKAIMKACGPRAFLDPKRLKYPIMTQDCRPNCKGIRTAKQRASMHAPRLVKQADAAGRAAGCRWARG